jgi:hypothetical protein
MSTRRATSEMPEAGDGTPARAQIHTAPVAQWIEQPPPKRKVASSTLAWGTDEQALVRTPFDLVAHTGFEPVLAP